MSNDSALPGTMMFDELWLPRGCLGLAWRFKGPACRRFYRRLILPSPRLPLILTSLSWGVSVRPRHAKFVPCTSPRHDCHRRVSLGLTSTNGPTTGPSLQVPATGAMGTKLPFEAERSSRLSSNLPFALLPTHLCRSLSLAISSSPKACVAWCEDGSDQGAGPSNPPMLCKVSL